MWNSFVAVFVKEFLHIRRDRGTLAAAFSIPIFQLILFGFIDQTVRNLPTVIVDHDHTEESRLLVDQLSATHTFRLSRFTSNPQEARDDIVAGRERVGVIIPEGFHDGTRGGAGSNILVLIDGSDSNASTQAIAAIDRLLAQKSLARSQVRGAATLAAQPVIMFNPAGRTANYIIPGLVAILLQVVAIILAAVSIVRERERGTFEQLSVTPINPAGLMLGKLAPYLVLSLIELAVVLFVMQFGFDVVIRGSVFFLFAMSTLYLFSLLSVGLFISTRVETQAHATQMAQMFLLPSIFLSGYIFAVEGLPPALYVIGQFLPATHMIAILRGVVLRGAGPIQLLPNVLALLAMSIVLAWASARRFKKMAA